MTAKQLTRIDSLASSMLLIQATNHPKMPDSAVLRRFQMRLALPCTGNNDETAGTFRGGA